MAKKKHTGAVAVKREAKKTNPARKAARKVATKKANPARKVATKKAARKSTAKKTARKKPNPAKVARVRKAAKGSAKKRLRLLPGKIGGNVSKWLKKTGRKVKNPSDLAAAVSAYEEFHGKLPEVVYDVEMSVEAPLVQAGIGKLVELSVINLDGDVVVINKLRGALLSQDIDGCQLYIVGGDQSVDPAEFGADGGHVIEALGVVEGISYGTEKVHLSPEDGGKAVYVHEFGENGGRLPVLLYDTRNRLLSFAGGSYSLPSVGIFD